ncbi:hypothetical protein [Streptomyces sp. NRRL B-3648]|uniref:hypothetical protein n=1 Tax=Streptomyces sp. NRRL B-3648 TaxID=1519493 RepID=UPI0006B0539F|nr:hypothetical protein [Streptomyces sp. NRRL B-3648]KOV90486.1 hypothetical protein ADL04_36085 [Streptomyces sp. NRRL B-3648]
MHIRSVLAATVLAAALAAAGATTAGATAHDTRDDEAVCSPYAGELSSLENHISWSGAHCSGYLR